jgi:uroporphyrin-III C-methyltransferase
LTHRGVATSVRFLTGHSREGGEDALDEATAAAADPHTTLVVYMGLGTLPSLVAQLTAAGLDARTPAVAVERGTTPEQRVVFAPLDALPSATGVAALRSPTLLVIGQVVGLAPGWSSAQEQPQQQGHDCARLALPDAVEAVLHQQQQQQGDLAAAAV